MKSLVLGILLTMVMGSGSALAQVSRPDDATCVREVGFDSGSACRLSNGNLLLKYNGFLKGPVDAFIRVSSRQPNGELSQSVQRVVSLSDRQVILGLSPRNCSPIISSGRFSGWYCQQPTEIDQALFQGRRSSDWVVELAFVNREGTWDSRYGENFRIEL